MGLQDELWLCNRLRDHGGMEVHNGITDYAIRMGRVREAIKHAGLEDAVIGRGKDGKPMLYREAFARIYGEEL